MKRLTFRLPFAEERTKLAGESIHSHSHAGQDFECPAFGLGPTDPLRDGLSAPLPFVAKRVRVELRSPTGKSSFTSPEKADILFKQKKIVWTDDTKLYACFVAAPDSRYVNLSKRCLWAGRPSGWCGPTVMQMV